MTKKDYQKFAEIFRNAEEAYPLCREMLDYIKVETILVFSKDNPKFDPVRFREACSLSQGSKND